MSNVANISPDMVSKINILTLGDHHSPYVDCTIVLSDGRQKTVKLDDSNFALLVQEIAQKKITGLGVATRNYFLENFKSNDLVSASIILTQIFNKPKDTHCRIL